MEKEFHKKIMKCKIQFFCQNQKNHEIKFNMTPFKFRCLLLYFSHCGEKSSATQSIFYEINLHHVILVNWKRWFHRIFAKKVTTEFVCVISTLCLFFYWKNLEMKARQRTISSTVATKFMNLKVKIKILVCLMY